MITAILIDDEPLARSILKEYLEAYPQITVVEECNDGFDGLKACIHHKPDLLFLDVQMPKINGFEMLELIEDPPAVIFVTAFDEYAIKAFETHAIDYLLKPVSKERFKSAVEKFLEHKGTPPGISAQKIPAITLQQKQRIVVKNGGKIKIIPVDDIMYFEASDDYVKIMAKDGSYLKKQTMSYFENALDQQTFVRTHRSYILNIQQITRIDPYEKDNYVAVLKNGNKIPVSKSGYTRLKQVLGI